MEAAAAGLGRSANGGVVAEANREAEDVKVPIRYKSEELVSKEDQIQSTKAEMGEVRQENQRLRLHVEKISKEYQTLQMQFQDIMARQEAKRNANTKLTTTATTIATASTLPQPDSEEHDVSLSLGRTSSSNIKREIAVVKSSSDDNRDVSDRGLALGLECSKFEASKTDHTSSTEPLIVTSADNSFEEEKKEDVVGETWPPPKVLKRSGEDEIDSHQNNAKRARVSVRARCDTPTMNDGCQWRKYGQKIAKGNPCPRAYYRCTIAPSCPVRKQVQRCAEDMSILITTYEGTHSHPLPAAATAMASTTSAAASMLLTGSSTSSRPASSTSMTPATTTSVGLHGLTFNPSTGMTSHSSPHQFYIQNNSQISPSPNTHPTITLDLTTSNPFAYPFATNPHFNRFASSTSYDPSRLFSSKSTSLNFASMDNHRPPSTISWAANQHSVLNYGNNMYPQSNNRNNHNLGSLTLASRQPQDNLYQSFMQKTNPNLHQQHQQQQHPLPETIVAATKAITADPSFQTALAAALTSIIGGTSGGLNNNNNNSGKVQVSSMENLSQKMKWPLDLQINSALQKGSGCGSTYLNSSSGTNAQSSSGQLMFPQSSSAAASKSKSTSPIEYKDQSSTD